MQKVLKSFSMPEQEYTLHSLNTSNRGICILWDYKENNSIAAISNNSSITISFRAVSMGRHVPACALRYGMKHCLVSFEKQSCK